MNNGYIHLFNFLIQLKIGIFTHLLMSIFLYPHPSIQKVLIYKESSEKALNVCDYKNWSVCELCKNNIQSLLISTQKLYFSDKDAINDVILQEPVLKWRHNYRHDISRDPFAKLLLFQTYSIIFIFRQIDRANFAVRGPSSFIIHQIF